MAPDDPYDLARFLKAQAGVIKTALAEVRAGRKRSHWMWFVFPQLRGLAHSETARAFGVTSLAEARAFLAHETLGPRLREMTEAVLDSPAQSLHALFGSPDDLKFRSCMTLFDMAEPHTLFRAALDRWCEGRADERTRQLLAHQR